MKENQRPLVFQMMILAALLGVIGCASDSQIIERGQQAMRKKAHSIMNPEALYLIPPEGLLVPNLVDISQDPPVETGPIFILPGTSLGYDEQLIKENTKEK